MMKILEIKKIGLDISWKLLYLGFYQGYLDGKEIINYATEKLEKGENNIKVYELAGMYEYEKEDIINMLQELAEQEKTQNDIEYRKLRATAVHTVLKSKNDNFINGLMELTELWVGLDYPVDSPHVIQGKDNEITVQEYYTEENYNKLYQKNITWLENEIKYLKEKQVK